MAREYSTNGRASCMNINDTSKSIPRQDLITTWIPSACADTVQYSTTSCWWQQNTAPTRENLVAPERNAHSSPPSRTSCWVPTKVFARHTGEPDKHFQGSPELSRITTTPGHSVQAHILCQTWQVSKWKAWVTEAPRKTRAHRSSFTYVGAWESTSGGNERHPLRSITYSTEQTLSSHDSNTPQYALF